MKICLPPKVRLCFRGVQRAAGPIDYMKEGPAAKIGDRHRGFLLTGMDAGVLIFTDLPIGVVVANYLVDGQGEPLRMWVLRSRLIRLKRQS